MLGKLIPWDERKAQARKTLQYADMDVSIVKAADVLHNTMTLIEAVRKIGAGAVSERFGRDLEQIVGHYSSIVAILKLKFNNQIMIILKSEKTIQDLKALIQQSNK